MLIRLKVDGFKNLRDVDLYFGPFTCIAGANGVGKSNIFDAIQFLSSLATTSLLEASKSIRGDKSTSYRGNEANSLFQKVGDKSEKIISFEAEMIVPMTATDELGQEATATNTALSYKLQLRHRDEEDEIRTRGPLEIIYESLDPIAKNSLEERIFFPHHKTEWLNKVAVGKRPNSVPYISTKPSDHGTVIRIHQDGSQGNPRNRQSGTLTRTILSAAEASESPTVVCARHEMATWRLLQLEPTALRSPDRILAPSRIGARGEGLAATLYRLAGQSKKTLDEEQWPVYKKLASTLRELVPEIRAIDVEKEDQFDSLSLFALMKDGSKLSARSLSDGTLRFLALAVLELDPEAVGVICMEEPENGLHPDRIPLILRLLRGISFDPKDSHSTTNPLRQVIVNTHSPLVVQNIPFDSLIVIEPGTATVWDGTSCIVPRFSCLDGTWRRQMPRPMKGMKMSSLMAYLSGISQESTDHDSFGKKLERVIDRKEIRAAFQLDMFKGEP